MPAHQAWKVVAQECRIDLPSSLTDSLRRIKITSRRYAEGHTEVNEKITPPRLLLYWERHNTTDVIVLRASLLLAEIANKPRTIVVHLSHHVEQKRLDVVK
jgi:hypothetical protein